METAIKIKRFSHDIENKIKIKNKMIKEQNIKA